jgi:hypothetical protein
VLLPQCRELGSQSIPLDLVQVEWRIQLGEDVCLHVSEGVSVSDRDDDEPKVLVHPSRERLLVDLVLAECLGQD